MRLQLDKVEVVDDTFDVDLPDDWRGFLEDALFQELHDEMLYNPALDGFEDGSWNEGVAPMRFADWFKPFNTGYRTSPYATVEFEGD